MVSIHSRNCKSLSPYNSHLVTVPNAPMTIGMFHIKKKNSLKGLGTYASFHYHSILFCCQLVQQSRQFCKFSFLFLITIKFGIQAEIRWSIWMSKSHRCLCVSFPRTDDGLYIYHLFVWSILNFLHIPQWITLPGHSCLVLYTFCAQFAAFDNYVIDGFISMTK